MSAGGAGECLPHICSAGGESIFSNAPAGGHRAATGTVDEAHKVLNSVPRPLLEWKELASFC